MIKNKTVAMSNTDQVTEDVSQLFTSIKLHEGYLCSNSGTNRLQSYLNNGNHSSIKSMRLFDGIDIIEYFTENKFAGDETYCFNMPLRNNTKIQIIKLQNKYNWSRCSQKTLDLIYKVARNEKNKKYSANFK